MNFEEHEIIELYETKVKKSKEYFNKSLSSYCPINGWNNSWRGNYASILQKDLTNYYASI